LLPSPLDVGSSLFVFYGGVLWASLKGRQKYPVFFKSRSRRGPSIFIRKAYPYGEVT
jgi:hypothetical protein